MGVYDGVEVGVTGVFIGKVVEVGITGMFVGKGVEVGITGVFVNEGVVVGISDTVTKRIQLIKKSSPVSS